MKLGTDIIEMYGTSTRIAINRRARDLSIKLLKIFRCQLFLYKVIDN